MTVATDADEDQFAERVPYVPYGPHACKYIEERLDNRVETPEELLADIGAALCGGGHKMTLYVYEERFVEIHYPDRLCPSCDDVVQMEVVIDRYADRRTRNCPECGRLEPDSLVEPEHLQIMLPSWRRLDIGAGLEAMPDE